MEFRILGPLEVHCGGRPVALGGAKQRALLAILLLNPNRVVASDRLIEELWGETPPESATKGLQGYVSALRKVLDHGGGGARDVLVTRPPGYAILVEPEQLDLGRFERLRDEARDAVSSGDAARASETLREALALWRGPPLADLAYASFAQSEIDRLEELRLRSLEERIEADLALGRHADVIGELEGRIDQHPLREHLRRQLMLALYRSGRQAEALQVYQDARQALTEELGIEPGRELREVQRAILNQDASLELTATAVEAAAKQHREPARSAFVGRGPELGELVSGLEAALAGRGTLFLVSGEPGIGKSRLAEELIGRARARGARVLVGRCWEAGGAPAYWPWMQTLRQYVRASDAGAVRSQLGAGGADLAPILPELRQQFPDLPEPPALDSEGARFRLFAATAGFLRNASEDRPLVLVLDDLHAADAPSLLLLRFLARELSSTRVLVVGAYREVDPTPGQPLTDMLAEVAREPVARRLTLGGLSEREVVEYVGLAGSEFASQELVTTLHEQTAGNPLFVGEIVRLLSVEGIRSDSAAEVRLVIPQSVRDVIARRLTHLSEECNRVLVLACVIGREFALDVLARVAGVSEDELLDVLDEAMGARIVSDVPGARGCLRFAHVLIRDTLYDGLTTARRLRLHRQVVAALERLYGQEPGRHLAQLGHHSIAGGDFHKGLRYARRAGDWGMALLAHEEAAHLYETALEAFDMGGLSDEEARCELLLLLGEAKARAGDSPAAKDAFVEAAGIARRVGLSCELARAAAGYGGRVVWARAGNDDRLVPLLEEGLAALGDGDVELRARLLARLAGALRDDPERGRRDRLSSEAVELARHSGDLAALAYALDGRAAAIVAPDTVAEGLALGTELCQVAGRSGDPERVVSAHMWRIIAQLLVGDVRGAEMDLAPASRIAQDLRQPAPLWEVCGAQAMLALAAGTLDEADTLGCEAFELGERTQPEAAIPVHRLQRYTLADFHGSLEEVEPAICDLVAEYPARRVFLCVLACLHARLGRPREAKRAVDDLARDRFSALPFDQEWLYGMSLLAETSALLGDADSAVVLYGLLAPWASFNAVDVAEGMRGSVARYLGMLAATMESWDDAELQFEEALAMNEQMGASPWLAHTRHDYAGMLLARGHPGDRERALELAGRALEDYRSSGMTAYTPEARARLERARSESVAR